MPAQDQPGATCLNCETSLAGRWCHACGQSTEARHRSLLHLGYELVETMTHADSRLWRTIRGLLFDPGRLTRDYLEGRRAGQIPPLRLFFVMLFLLFGIGSLTYGHIRVPPLDGETHTEVARALSGLVVGGHPAMTHWLRGHLQQAADHPAGVLEVVREWAERFTILLLPIAACLLRGLYPRRGFSLFDDMIFSMHALCFVCVVLIGLFVWQAVGQAAGLGSGGWLLLLLPVHLFFHMRGLYRSGIVGTLARMLVLLVGSTAASLLLLTGLAAIGLQLGARS